MFLGRNFPSSVAPDYHYAGHSRQHPRFCKQRVLSARYLPYGGAKQPRRDKAIEMDDSHDMDRSGAQIWAAEPSGDTHVTGKPAFTIGELSREFGVTLRALRFYENKGLISPQRDGLSRLYSEGDRNRLALILKGKKLGFTLGEIRQMIAAEEGEADSQALTMSREKCLEQIELLKRQKVEIEEGLNELSRIYSSLGGKSAEKDRKVG